MGKYLITGRQGSGKTTVIKLLEEQGYTAYNTDDLPEATKLQNKETGEVIDWPDGNVDWSMYAWNWQKPEIELLLASDDTVFLGAVVSNQVDFYPMFDKVFVITVRSEALRQRLSVHEHASHYLPGVIDRILTNHSEKQQRFIEEGAISISGEKPPKEIVEEILSNADIKWS
jgi:broad-specificity NMP kinase